MISRIAGAIDNVLDRFFEPTPTSFFDKEDEYGGSKGNGKGVANDDLSVVSLQVGRTVYEAPPRMRTELWLSLLQQHGGSGAAAMKSYESYVTASLPPQQDQEIEKDVGRTFPGHPVFGTGKGKRAMFKVLRAYVAYDPQIGYAQGMNFLAGLLLTYLEENEAFGVLVLIMKDRGLRDLYEPGDGLALLQARLFQLGCLAPPRLTAHLESHGVLPVLFASSWFLTCFAGDFPFHFAARVMDLIITDTYGFSTTMKVAVHILESCADALLQMSDMEDMVDLLKREVPKWPRYKLQELLTEALGKGWTERQLRILEEVNDVETVSEAVCRLEKGKHMNATHKDDTLPVSSELEFDLTSKNIIKDSKTCGLEFKTSDISIQSNWDKEISLDPAFSNALSAYMTSYCSVDPLVLHNNLREGTHAPGNLKSLQALSCTPNTSEVPHQEKDGEIDAPTAEEWEFTEYTGAEPVQTPEHSPSEIDAISKLRLEGILPCSPFMTPSVEVFDQGTTLGGISKSDFSNGTVYFSPADISDDKAGNTFEGMQVSKSFSENMEQSQDRREDKEILSKTSSINKQERSERRMSHAEACHAIQSLTQQQLESFRTCTE